MHTENVMIHETTTTHCNNTPPAIKPAVAPFPTTIETLTEITPCSSKTDPEIIKSEMLKKISLTVTQRSKKINDATEIIAVSIGEMIDVIPLPNVTSHGNLTKKTTPNPNKDVGEEYCIDFEEDNLMNTSQQNADRGFNEAKSTHYPYNSKNFDAQHSSDNLLYNNPSTIPYSNQFDKTSFQTEINVKNFFTKYGIGKGHQIVNDTKHAFYYTDNDANYKSGTTPNIIDEREPNDDALPDNHPKVINPNKTKSVHHLRKYIESNAIVGNQAAQDKSGNVKKGNVIEHDSTKVSIKDKFKQWLKDETKNMGRIEDVISAIDRQNKIKNQNHMLTFYETLQTNKPSRIVLKKIKNKYDLKGSTEPRMHKEYSDEIFVSIKKHNKSNVSITPKYHKENKIKIEAESHNYDSPQTSKEIETFVTKKNQDQYKNIKSHLFHEMENPHRSGKDFCKIAESPNKTLFTSIDIDTNWEINETKDNINIKPIRRSKRHSVQKCKNLLNENVNQFVRTKNNNLYKFASKKMKAKSYPGHQIEKLLEKYCSTITPNDCYYYNMNSPYDFINKQQMHKHIFNTVKYKWNIQFLNVTTLLIFQDFSNMSTSKKIRDNTFCLPIFICNYKIKKIKSMKNNYIGEHIYILDMSKVKYIDEQIRPESQITVFVHHKPNFNREYELKYLGEKKHGTVLPSNIGECEIKKMNSDLLSQQIFIDNFMNNIYISLFNKIHNVLKFLQKPKSMILSVKSRTDKSSQNLRRKRMTHQDNHSSIISNKDISTEEKIHVINIMTGNNNITSQDFSNHTESYDSRLLRKRQDPFECGVQDTADCMKFHNLW